MGGAARAALATCRSARTHRTGHAGVFPGASFAYSNTNYLLLGEVIERVTGLALAEALRRWVIEPAGLRNTYHAFEELGQPPVARAHLDTDDLDFWPGSGGVIDTTIWVQSHGFGDAPVQSTSADLNRFARELTSQGGWLLPASREAMLTPQAPATEYGLGRFVTYTASGVPVYYHTGGHFGYQAFMSYWMANDVSVALLVNGAHGRYSEPFANLLQGLDALVGELDR